LREKQKARWLAAIALLLSKATGQRGKSVLAASKRKSF
jgi:hypothetical protein